MARNFIFVKDGNGSVSGLPLSSIQRIMLYKDGSMVIVLFAVSAHSSALQIKITKEDAEDVKRLLSE